MNEKAKFVQLCCDFHNEHSESDKQWFARNYDQCDEPHQKDNICMYQWQFPLYVLRSQQAEIEQLKKQLTDLESKHEALHALCRMRAVIATAEKWSSLRPHIKRAIKLLDRKEKALLVSRN